jgi:hypothetical protein
MLRPSSRLLRLALPPILATSVGCKSDVSTVTDEKGTWALQQFDVTGDGALTNVDELREDGFMVRFDPGRGVVAAANCHGTDDPTVDDPGAADCDISVDGRDWTCHCFAYDFADDLMRWKEFDGAIPELPGEMKGEPFVACSGDAPPSADWPHRMLVTATGKSVMTLQPFPDGLWGTKDMACSQYIFQRVSNMLFDRSPCAAECGITD